MRGDRYACANRMSPIALAKAQRIDFLFMFIKQRFPNSVCGINLAHLAP